MTAPCLIGARLRMAVALIGVSTSALAEPPAFDGKVVLFGNLHAHSKLSDDISNAGNEMLPIKAFEYADAHGLDFLAISDHQKATDSSHRLWMTQSEYKTQLYDVAMAYNAAHPNGFVAIPAIEWGNTATGNHVNVFGLPVLPPDSIKDKDYDELFTWAATNAKFVQFNHPYAWDTESNRNRDVGNFGENLYASKEEFVKAVGPVAKTVSVISSVAGGHLSGQHRASEAKTHRERHTKGWNKYLQFLNMGFHISPAANQDTHSTNWGTVTAARTAVWADAFTYDGFMDAVKKNRVYVTEDDELVVTFRVSYKGASYWMGEIVNLSANEDDVMLEVSAWQGAGSDNDNTNEGPYTVTIYIDADGVGGQQATLLDTIPGVNAKEILKRPLQVSPGQYIFVGVTEENGKDNPVGDGEDEVNNDTGDHSRDGKRDDMDDSAWTSAIWFVEGSAAPSTFFVWSKNSSLYHDSTCWAVKQIGQANRRESSAAPTGKTKHACAISH